MENMEDRGSLSQEPCSLIAHLVKKFQNKNYDLRTRTHSLRYFGKGKSAASICRFEKEANQ